MYANVDFIFSSFEYHKSSYWFHLFDFDLVLLKHGNDSTTLPESTWNHIFAIQSSNRSKTQNSNTAAVLTNPSREYKIWISSSCSSAASSYELFVGFSPPSPYPLLPSSDVVKIHHESTRRPRLCVSQSKSGASSSSPTLWVELFTSH